MIDFAKRIHELAATQFRMEDREILLAAAFECPPTPACWLILEPTSTAVNCEYAWFAFGGHLVPRSLAELRSMRPRFANERIRQWFDDSPQPPVH